MMMLAAAQLIALQTLDQRTIYVNPTQVVIVGETSPDPAKKQTAAKTNCIITFSNGKFITVEEACASVRQRLEEAKR
jgi:uncharacterized protein YlzI (FlbEa/FlbD family)